MAETFYSALGVDADADTETIKQAYREKVKTHHPDVSDESDAAEQFQRITEARDVLVDADDRNRYDRLGHDAYVRRHLDSTAWTASDTSGQRTRRGDRSSRRSRSDGTARGQSGSQSDSTDTSGRNGRSEAGAGESTGGSGRGERTSRSTDRRKSRTSTRERGGRAGNRATDDRAAWMGEDGWSTSNGTNEARASSTRGHSQRRGRANGWREQHAASNAYSPTGRDAGVATGDGYSRFSELARGIGPWIVFHFVFLVSAFVTIYLLMSWSPTVPTMFGSLLLLGAAIFFSILHMVSRIYS